MIQGMKFESKKYVLTWGTLLMLLLQTFAAIGLMHFNEYGYVFEKNTREIFFTKMKDQQISLADKQKLQEEVDQLQTELYREDGTPIKTEIKKPGKYAGTKLDEYGFLGEAIDCIDCIQKRNSNMELMVSDYQGELVGYHKEKNTTIVDQKKLTAAVCCELYGVLPCLFVIFVLSNSFSIEWESHLADVVHVTRKGRERIILTKLLHGVFWSVISNFYFWGIYLAYQWFAVGMRSEDWSSPLFLVEGYQMCASGLTIFGYILRQIAAAALATIVIAVITMLLSKLTCKGIFALLAALVIFILGIIPDVMEVVLYNSIFLVDSGERYFLPRPEFYRLLKFEKLGNPISLFQIKYFAQQPRYIQLGQYQYSMVIFPLLIAVILIGICIMLLLWTKRGGKK